MKQSLLFLDFYPTNKWGNFSGTHGVLCRVCCRVCTGGAEGQGGSGRVTLGVKDLAPRRVCLDPPASPSLCMSAVGACWGPVSCCLWVVKVDPPASPAASRASAWAEAELGSPASGLSLLWSLEKRLGR